MDKPQIRFIDASYKTFFFVDDGEDIEIEIEDGWKRYACHYIDEYHFKLEDHVYHIYEFALLRERIPYRYRPVKTQMGNKPSNGNQRSSCMEKPKIRFINASYETLFFIEDGEEIEAEINGVWKRYTCRYLDECHLEIGGHAYHIREFAERMQRAGQQCRPVALYTEK